MACNLHIAQSFFTKNVPLQINVFVDIQLIMCDKTKSMI